MSTRKNYEVTIPWGILTGAGLILGTVIGSFIRLITTGYFNVTIAILLVIVYLGIGLALLGWLAESGKAPVLKTGDR